MLGKVVLDEHPGAPDLGTGNAAGAGGLSECFGMDMQEGSGFRKAERLHGKTSGTRRAAEHRKPRRRITGRR